MPASCMSMSGAFGSRFMEPEVSNKISMFGFWICCSMMCSGLTRAGAVAGSAHTTTRAAATTIPLLGVRRDIVGALARDRAMQRAGQKVAALTSHGAVAAKIAAPLRPDGDAVYDGARRRARPAHVG